MARKQHPECGACDHRLMTDIDTSGEYGVYRLFGCKRPTPRKFAGVTPFGCADYAGPEKEHKFNVVCGCCNGTGKIRETEFVDGDIEACMTCNGKGR